MSLRGCVLTPTEGAPLRPLSPTRSAHVGEASCELFVARAEACEWQRGTISASPTKSKFSNCGCVPSEG